MASLDTGSLPVTDCRGSESSLTNRARGPPDRGPILDGMRYRSGCSVAAAQ